MEEKIELQLLEKFKDNI